MLALLGILSRNLYSIHRSPLSPEYHTSAVPARQGLDIFSMYELARCRLMLAMNPFSGLVVDIEEYLHGVLKIRESTIVVQHIVRFVDLYSSFAGVVFDAFVLRTLQVN